MVTRRAKRRRLKAGEFKLVRSLNNFLDHALAISFWLKATKAGELRRRIERIISAARPPRQHNALRDALNAYFDFLQTYNALPHNFRLVYIPNLYKVAIMSNTSLGELAGVLFPDAYADEVGGYTKLVEIRTEFAGLLDELHLWMLKDFKPAMGVCPQCGKVFILKRTDQRFCSDTCRWLAAQERRMERTMASSR